MRLENNSDPRTRQSPHPFSNGSPVSTPLKGPSSNFTNGSSGKAESNGYANGHSPTRPTGPFFGHDREEVTRILIQSLTDLGYHRAAGELSRESGYELEVPSVAAFRSAVQNGEWAEAEALLFGVPLDDDGGGVYLKGNGYAADTSAWLKSSRTNMTSSGSAPGLPLAEGANKQEMLFWMRQQKYLELLEERDMGSALMVLRHELEPLHQDTNRLHMLTSLVMCPSAEDLRSTASWDGAAGESRNQLLSELSKYISPSVMIPEHRLAVLLDQVQDNQVRSCLYHNTNVTPSLYHDHVCEKDDFPLQTVLELHDHTDEVWYLEFSHDGSMLATTGKDNCVIVYETSSWKPLHRLEEQHGIGETGHRVAHMTEFTYPVTTAAWSPDGQSFVVGSQDSERPLMLYQFANQHELHNWKHDLGRPFRVNDLSICADGSRLAAITSDNYILIYNLPSRIRTNELKMDDKLTCINLSRDGKTVLVSMNEGRLLLLDAETGTVIQRYKGLKQSEFVIRSQFGGAGQNFVISGSEDAHVYIWRKHTGAQVAALEAHGSGTVNSVAWHPTNQSIFASAGDDRRVRIWSNAHPAIYMQ